MARKLYTPLQSLYNDIREVIVSPVYRTMCDLHLVVKDVALVPQSRYEVVKGNAEVDRAILDITRRIMDVLQESLSF